MSMQRKRQEMYVVPPNAPRRYDILNLQNELRETQQIEREIEGLGQMEISDDDLSKLQAEMCNEIDGEIESEVDGAMLSDANVDTVRSDDSGGADCLTRETIEDMDLRSNDEAYSDDLST
eukprot:3449380-Pleurochrysis_carterae.AAC.4